MKSQKINIRIDEKDKKSLEEIAKDRGMTISQLLRATIMALIATGCVTSYPIGNNQHVINYQGNQYSNSYSVSQLTYERAHKICLNYDVVSSDSVVDSRGQWHATTIIKCN